MDRYCEVGISDAGDATGSFLTCDNRAVTNFERITVDPADGWRTMRSASSIPVATVLRLLAGGLSERDILADYPDLELADVRECLQCAASSAMERELPLTRTV